MHLYLITRGIKAKVDDFITQLQGKYLPMMWRKKPEDPLSVYHVQLGVRPIQLWEIVFPEEQKDLVLSTCLAQRQPSEGMTQHKKHNKFIWALRKMLGCEPIPDYDNSKVMPIGGEGVELVGIGLKKDYWIDKEGKHHPEKVEDSYEGL